MDTAGRTRKTLFSSSISISNKGEDGDGYNSLYIGKTRKEARSQRV